MYVQQHCDLDCCSFRPTTSTMSRCGVSTATSQTARKASDLWPLASTNPALSLFDIRVQRRDLLRLSTTVRSGFGSVLARAQEMLSKKIRFPSCPFSYNRNCSRALLCHIFNVRPYAHHRVSPLTTPDSLASRAAAAISDNRRLAHPWVVCVPERRSKVR